MLQITNLINSHLSFKKEHDEDIHIEINSILNWFRLEDNKKTWNNTNMSLEDIKKQKKTLLISLIEKEVENRKHLKSISDEFEIADKMLKLINKN